MATVTLHIYDVTGSAAVREMNKLLLAVGTGAFHGGVEVYGKEWSYGYADEGSGVFCCTPMACEGHQYRESVVIGETAMSPQEVGQVLEQLMEAWPGNEYDLLRRNCVLFSDELCVQLGVGNIPRWVKNLAGAGATVLDGFKQASDAAQTAAIIAAAKAEKFDEQYKLGKKADAAVSSLRSRAAELDEKYKIRSKADELSSAVSAKAAIVAMKAAAKASELDEQYRLKEKALAIGADAASMAARAGSAVGSHLKGFLSAKK
eukprot:TRINITY_DN38925_c0_g1_i1.p1 TRINITY_DN38925_c0_g1~~TRINITY_DN38925_c0_g1_i1.p1  ORF type:complete len:272 (-),score=59.21 TRINITY_DN38925_c0_g1_i1:115-897(-)